MGFNREIFEKTSRMKAEDLIANITEKDPIEKTRLANTYWDDHLRRIGTGKKRRW